MNIIDDINLKVTELTALGLTNTTKVRRALTTAITDCPNRDPSIILQQQYTLMLAQYHSGNTEYCLEV